MISSFFNLDPETVLKTCENAGFRPTGLFTQLNSYENRVFDIQLEGAENIIAKFYRPQRWSKEAILQEHHFLNELNEAEIPSLNPIRLHNHSTLIESAGIYVAFFPKFRGRMPQELSLSDLNRIGQLFARVHNVGAKSVATDRPVMDTSYYGGWETLGILQSWVVPEVADRYFPAAETILEFIDQNFDPSEFIRIHGDAHKGNILQMQESYFLVDFDDFCNGPAIQDFWMLLSYNNETLTDEKDAFIDGYQMFREFPFHQLNWIEALRGLRIIMYAGWIAKRWQDPSFPRLFPDFGTYSYWAEEVEALEKISWNLDR
ncbi:MAG: serine/threonine protein kinase [Bdellovibrionaceae bacterium]|nr:serine/threonine protein kinase [Pseudobdellovibrionaceae bacterium]